MLGWKRIAFALNRSNDRLAAQLAQANRKITDLLVQLDREHEKTAQRISELNAWSDAQNRTIDALRTANKLLQQSKKDTGAEAAK